VFFRHQCFSDGADFPNLEWLEQQYTSGRFGVMGELYNQYAAIPFDDPRMDPYYKLAERLGIPVAFHTQSAPPLTAQQCCPAFRISNGNPLLLENVLVKYPQLKVYIMHANPLVYPEVLDLLAQFPKVHVDISQWQMAYTRKKFHRLLQEYADAGMTGRIMFGSDGGAYEQAFAAYESAEFLTDQQLEGIFCRNAERFLKKRGLCD
jgi:predicted TIM-barrel fold metal-dependent hydrolase